jgi:hypothetical protein
VKENARAMVRVVILAYEEETAYVLKTNGLSMYRVLKTRRARKRCTCIEKVRFVAWFLLAGIVKDAFYLSCIFPR